MAITIRPVAAPTIRLRGTLILVNSLGQITDEVSVNNTYNKIVQLGKKKFRNYGILIFRGKVRVKAQVPYTVKTYGGYTNANERQSDLVYVGEQITGNNTNRAEIVFSLNGKDPKRTQKYIYKAPITLRGNLSGDNTVIKARTYYQGRWSVVTTIEIAIVQSNQLKHYGKLG